MWAGCADIPRGHLVPVCAAGAEPQRCVSQPLLYYFVSFCFGFFFFQERKLFEHTEASGKAGSCGVGVCRLWEPELPGVCCGTSRSALRG